MYIVQLVFPDMAVSVSAVKKEKKNPTIRSCTTEEPNRAAKIIKTYKRESRKTKRIMGAKYFRF